MNCVFRTNAEHYTKKQKYLFLSEIADSCVNHAYLHGHPYGNFWSIGGEWEYLRWTLTLSYGSWNYLSLSALVTRRTAQPYMMMEVSRFFSAATQTIGLLCLQNSQGLWDLQDEKVLCFGLILIWRAGKFPWPDEWVCARITH